MCDWLLYRMGKTQSVLVGKDELEDGLFSLDVFLSAVVLVCSYDIYCDARTDSPKHFIELFPEALEALSRKQFWSDQVIRVKKEEEKTLGNEKAQRFVHKSLLNEISAFSVSPFLFHFSKKKSQIVILFSDLRVPVPFEHSASEFADQVCENRLRGADLQQKS